MLIILVLILKLKKESNTSSKPLQKEIPEKMGMQHGIPNKPLFIIF